MRAVPVSDAERIHQLDAIRGFALFGIFLVNMPTFLHPMLFLPVDGLPYNHSILDEWIRILFHMFVQTKFYTIFSFLFGAGFHLFMSRAEKKNLPVKPMYLRRITVLFLMGMVHLIFLWYGDILHTYALSGIMLLLFYKREEQTIRKWAWSLLLVLQLLYGLVLFIPSDPSTIDSSSQAIASKAVEVYTQGSWMEWLQFRIAYELPIVGANEFLAVFSVFPLFLFGFSAAKRGVFVSGDTNRPAIKRVWWSTLLLSLVFVTMIPLVQTGLVQFPAPKDVAMLVFVGWSGLTLCAFYICSFLLLYNNQRWRNWLQHLEPVGRMALTNYLAQTVITVVIVWVLGLYGALHLSSGLFLCLLIFPLQIVASRWWLTRYQFGPVEWFWRCMTYARYIPMKRKEGNYEI
ncbi:DUF418 domain-containing protein [Brevibacillus sp. NRS-1366]|uniref:DUF418 domain-containing protein n=1 Tax=Brevibacillus sp. NRS-1366 TaxID=3233899 RepID=UPI003D2423EB